MKIIELSSESASEYQLNYHVNPLVGKLFSVNQCTPEQVQELMDPQPFIPSQHELFRNVADLILKAAASKEKIMVCGDYDADGLCATAIVVSALRKLKCDVGFYIPDRFNEGYGLSKETVIKAAERGYTLFITVDNGVSAYEAIDEIRALGLTSCILDHHEITELIHCDVLVHPTLLEHDYRSLCGSGLALQLAEMLIGDEPYLNVLASIATIGDMVEMWSSNRKIVRKGLKLLNENHFPVIEALLDKPVDHFDEETIAFQIVPKLNVVGRLADQANANRVVDYLCSDAARDIEATSTQIKVLNSQRRQISADMYETAKLMKQEGNVLILTHHSFHEGVVGITAGRLAKEFGRPVFVLADKGDTYKGSARSVADVDLRTLTQDVQRYCIRYGGHAMAAGLEIRKEDLDKFKSGLNSAADLVDWQSAQDTVTVMSLSPQEFSMKDYAELQEYAPFGQGFRFPLVYLKEMKVNGFSRIGAKKFPKWLTQWGNQTVEVLMFQENGQSSLYENSSILNVVGKLKIETFRGREKLTIIAEVIS